MARARAKASERSDSRASPGMLAIERWFASSGRAPFEFQREAWQRYAEGCSGLIHAPTGMGKTQAAWLGPVIEWLDEQPQPSNTHAADEKPRKRGRSAFAPLRVLWITPLRALASDTSESLRDPIVALGLPWSVESRTGDTSASLKASQRVRLPTALVTTPESLSLMLSYPHWRDLMGTLRCVVVDEWHELIGTKRGVQVELALARLRAHAQASGRTLRTWGVSATLGNIDQAARVLVGPHFPAEKLRLVRGTFDKRIEIHTLLPDSLDRFPWSGHIGLRLLPKVVESIEQARTTLLFTNTRSQAEIWFRALNEARPDWLGTIALHHGSLDREIRGEVERRLGGDAAASGDRDGSSLRCVVCTSSLDLGVDFSPVDQVIQLGSPKGVARLLQRAGRSGHQPGATSRILGVPTSAFELVEFAAARVAMAGQHIEARPPREKPIDCLVQHLVTCALGGGFSENEMLGEVRATHAFRDLTDAEWHWALDFVVRGGASLRAYPQYAKLIPIAREGIDATQADRAWGVASPTIARWHRLNIGTIVADPAITVRMGSGGLGGKVLGTIEESFITRLRPGQRFVFAGRTLELVRIHELTAYTRQAKRSGAIPSWDGGKMPLSSNLSAHVVGLLADASRGRFEGPEMQAVKPLLEVQAAWSILPVAHELLLERTSSRAGHHTFIFPMAGRLVHEGLASLLIHRLTRAITTSASAVVTDYGIELLTPIDKPPLPADEQFWRPLLSLERLLPDLLESLNSTQMARRQFREIARIAGLVLQSFPGQRKPARQVQASADLFYDVFEQFDQENLLLAQAQRELLEGQLEVQRLHDTLASLASRTLRFIDTPHLTPMAFPLWAESIRGIHSSSEAWSSRVKDMVIELEAEAGKAAKSGR